MALGLVLSTVCTSESTALMGAIASFYPTIILSGKYIYFLYPKSSQKPTIMMLLLPTGVMWPFEGMPAWLRYISGVLPATYPAQAMRAIMGRGISYTSYYGWRGHSHH